MTPLSTGSAAEQARYHPHAAGLAHREGESASERGSIFLGWRTPSAPCGRVAGGIAAPGSHRSRRDSLPSPGSSHQPIRTHEPIANGRTGRVLLGFGMFPRFLPGPEPRLTEPNIPGEPAPWLPRHPRKQRVHGYYGPVRRRAPPRHSPSRGHPGHAATRAAVSTLAFSRSVQEPQTRLTPPLRRAPPGQYTGIRQAHPGGLPRAPGFDAVSVSFDASTAHAPPVIPAERFWNVFLVPT